VVRGYHPAICASDTQWLLELLAETYQNIYLLSHWPCSPCDVNRELAVIM